MRQKKKVLLYCADAELGAHIAWMLDIRCIVSGWGVIVTRSFSPQDFLWESSAPGADFDCVVVVRTAHGSMRATGEGASADEQVCVLLSAVKVAGLTIEARNGLPCEDYNCAGRLVPGAIEKSIGQLIQHVDLACSRRMGPQLRYSFELTVIPPTFREATAL